MGTNLLTAGGDSLHAPTIRRIIGQVAALHRMEIQVVLVSSGAIAAGRETLGLMTRRPNGGLRRKDIPFKQVMAALGQSRLMQRYNDGFAEHGMQVAQALITKGDLDNREGYLNVRNTLEGLIALGVVPIVNENDVVDVHEIGEIVFGDNDTLSAAVANVVDAGLLIILTDTDGLYETDPRRDPDAKLIHRVEEIDERVEALAGAPGSARGRGGMATKIEAAKAATAIGIPVLVAGGHVPRILERVVAGEEIGTLFARRDDRVHSKERWLLSGLGSRGQITVDEGAVTALRASRCSLLPRRRFRRLRRLRPRRRGRHLRPRRRPHRQRPDAVLRRGDRANQGREDRRHREAARLSLYRRDRPPRRHGAPQPPGQWVRRRS